MVLQYLLTLKELRETHIPKNMRKVLPFIFFGVFLLLILLMFPQKLASGITGITLLGVASFSTMYKRVTRVSVGIELVSFATIIFLFSQGLLMALFAVFIMTLLAALIEGQLDSFPKQFFANALVCIFMLPFLGLPILVGGMIFVIFKNIVLFVMYKILWGSGFLSAFGPVTLNVILHFVLLDKYGELLLKLLGV